MVRTFYRVSTQGFGKTDTLDNAQRLRHFSKEIRSLQQLIAFVRRTDDRPQPRLAFRHGRITHRWRKDSRLKKLFRKFERLRRIAHMNRNNGRLAHLELESALLQFALEKFRIRPKFPHQFIAFWRIQQRERRLASRRSSRRMRSRKEKRPRPQIQKIDQIARAANI